MHFVCCCPGTTFAVFLGGGRAFWWPARSFFALKHHDNGATSMCVGLFFLSCWISLGAKKCCCPCCWRQTWGPLLKRMRLKALPWALVCTRCSKGNGLCFKRNNQNKSKTTICHGGFAESCAPFAEPRLKWGVFLWKLVHVCFLVADRGKRLNVTYKI